MKTLRVGKEEAKPSVLSDDMTIKNLNLQEKIIRNDKSLTRLCPVIKTQI